MDDAASKFKAIDVRRAFIDGIRTVLIVDDRMRPYDQVIASGFRDSISTGVASPEACSVDYAGLDESSVGQTSDYVSVPTAVASSTGGGPPNEDIAAGALIRDFRKRGWLCDIVNDEFKTLAIERAAKCDLVVLDYMLGDDWTASAGIIAKLSASSRMHLVVVYTREKEEDVWWNLCLTLAGPPSNAEIDETVLDVLHRDAISETPRSTRQDVVDYLTGKRPRPKRIENRKGGPSVDEQLALWRLHKDAFEATSGLRKTSPVNTVDPVGGTIEASSGTLRWLRCNNVFVVVQHKNQQALAGGVELGDGDSGVIDAVDQPLGGDTLVARLTAALQEWNPSFFRRMLRYVRNEIAAHGLGADAEILRGPIGEAALLVYANSGHPDVQVIHRRRIYLQVFESVLHKLLDDDVVRNSADDVPVSSDVFAHAASVTKIDAVKDRRRVFFRLNSFLAFEEKLPTYLRTGTVFMLPDSPGFVGICVTPECDLVPRDKAIPAAPALKKSDEDLKNAKPKAARAVLWRLARLLPPDKEDYDKKLDRFLEGAESGYALFLCAKDAAGQEREFVVELRPDKPDSIPKARMFFVSNNGCIRSDQFEATQIYANEDGTPAVESPKQYRVIGQLRESYATRVLHESGQEFSRVGVDFVNMKK